MEREPTLTEALARKGYTHRPGGQGLYRRKVFDSQGVFVGDMDAKEAWAFLESLK